MVVKATGLSAPATGQVHRVWLVGDDGAFGRYLGDVIPDATGAVAFTWDQPAGENLLAQYSQVSISLESGGAGAKPGGTTVLTGKLDAASLSQVRRLLSRWPDSRYGAATVPGLRRQAQIARYQAWVLREAAVNGDWDTARRKAEQLVNLVEGRRGQFYADHNGDGRIDEWVYWNGAVAIRGEFDKDFDGKLDRWEYFRDGNVTKLIKVVMNYCRWQI